MKKRLFAVLLAVLIVASLCAVTAFAEDKPVSEASSLETVINAANPGDTITLEAKTYNIGDLIVRKAVNIKGAGPETVLVGSIAYSNCEASEDTTISVSDLTIKPVENNTSTQQAINWANNSTSFNGANLVVNNVTVVDYLFAIGVNSGAKNCTLTVNNLTLDNVWCGANVSEGAGNKIEAFDVADGSTVKYEVQVFGGAGAVNNNTYYETYEDCVNDPTRANPALDSNETMPSLKDEGGPNWPAVAQIGDKYYGSLDAAIEAASDGDTIELTEDVTVDATVTLPNDKALTIVGNGNSIEINHTSSSATHAKALIVNAPLTLDGVELTINGYAGAEGAHMGDGIQVGAGTSDNATLTIKNGSVVTLDGVNNAMVMPGGAGAKVTVEDSKFVLNDIGGNGSNGGTYVFDNADVDINGCSSYGLSVASLTTTGNTRIDISGTGLSAIYGHQTLNFGGNTVVNVDKCGPKEVGSGSADYGYRYAPIQLRSGEDGTYFEGAQSIVIGSNATINVTNCEDEDGNSINNIYVVGNTSYVNNGTVNANVVMAEAPVGQSTVTYVNNGAQISAKYYSNGTEITLFDKLTQSGYEFRGWRCSADKKLYQPGAEYTVTGNVTFTAVWDAIDIPDTYPIEIADAANGEVSTSLTNASRGSVITVTVDPDEGYELGSLTVTGPDGRVDVKRVNATTYTFVMPDGEVTVRAAFVVEGLPFTDVSANQWFYEAVSYVYTNGMMEGDSATTFNPDGGMTRAMFWAVLARIDGETVTGSNWVELARAWAMESGTSDGTDPNGLVTREMMVTMLYRFAGSPAVTGSLSGYTDAASVADWAEDAMVWAIDEGVISGVTATTLAPQGTATRAQCATILMRYAESVA